MRTLTEGRGLIGDLAVLPTYRGRGVEAALLEAVVQRAAIGVPPRASETELARAA